MVLHCKLDCGAEMTHVDALAVEQVSELLASYAHTLHLVKFRNHFWDHYCLQVQAHLEKVSKVIQILVIFGVMGVFKEWLFYVRHDRLGILADDFRSQHVIIVRHVIFDLLVKGRYCQIVKKAWVHIEWEHFCCFYHILGSFEVVLLDHFKY